jgi:DNA-binding protein HU-beta
VATELITQAEMVTDLAERTGWSKGDVKSFLSHLEDFVVENVSEGYRVKLAGVVVGAVVAAKRKARMGRNPATGEDIKIPAKPASAKLKAKIVKPLKDVSLPSVKRLQNMS